MLVLTINQKLLYRFTGVYVYFEMTNKFVR